MFKVGGKAPSRKRVIKNNSNSGTDSKYHREFFFQSVLTK